MREKKMRRWEKPEREVRQRKGWGWMRKSLSVLTNCAFDTNSWTSPSGLWYYCHRAAESVDLAMESNHVSMLVLLLTQHFPESFREGWEMWVERRVRKTENDWKERKEETWTGLWTFSEIPFRVVTVLMTDILQFS